MLTTHKISTEAGGIEPPTVNCTLVKNPVSFSRTHTSFLQSIMKQYETVAIDFAIGKF
ncbi:MAG: hypothetical protein ICV80_08670 [Microcoleus sp. T1-bin1]|nr:hypothetical protein [Microcoleus sp. T1-bin1]